MTTLHMLIVPSAWWLSQHHGEHGLPEKTCKSTNSGVQELQDIGKSPSSSTCLHAEAFPYAATHVWLAVQYLPAADHIVVIKDGRISAQGGYAELKAAGVDFAKFEAASKSTALSAYQCHGSGPCVSISFVADAALLAQKCWGRLWQP